MDRVKFTTNDCNARRRRRQKEDIIVTVRKQSSYVYVSNSEWLARYTSLNLAAGVCYTFVCGVV
jgi:hypothetical protein